jgi:AAA family ATP:ADP antiporter
MKFTYLAKQLGIKNYELNIFFSSFTGAFLIISFLVFARAFRESFYLTNFDISTLPYIITLVTLISIPTVTIFTYFITNYKSCLVLKYVTFIQIITLLLLIPLLESSKIAIVLFYIITTLGSLIITSGFWLIISELFSLASAKRLFGLISVGGTFGAMIAGSSISYLVKYFKLIELVPILLVLLSLFFILIYFFIKTDDRTISNNHKIKDQNLLIESLENIWQNPYLRIISLIIMTATLITTLLDYQFKEMISNHFIDKESLSSFLGKFYGFAGAITLFLQIIIGSHILKRFGIIHGLSILPIIVLIGSIGFLFIPSLWMIILVRGMDNSLRRSLHRSLIEILFIPLSFDIRCKTKAFIDLLLDGIAEALGATIIILWITLAHFQSSYLSIIIIMLVFIFIRLNINMKKHYFQEIYKLSKNNIKKHDHLLNTVNLNKE